MRSQQPRFLLMLSTAVAVFVMTVTSIAIAGESKAAKIARAIQPLESAATR